MTAWDTLAGSERGFLEAEGSGGSLAFSTPPFTTDLALAVRASSRLRHAR